MKQVISIVVASLFIVGCSPSAPSTPNSSTGTAASTNQVQAPNDGIQTIQGKGFTVQIRKGWSVVSTNPLVVLGTPTDKSKEIFGVPVGIDLTPQSSEGASQKYIEPVLRNDRAVGGIESDDQCTVAGVSGTKLIAKTTSKISDKSDDLYTSRSLKVYVPLSVGVLSINASGPNDNVPNAMPEIEWMMSTIKPQ